MSRTPLWPRPAALASALMWICAPLSLWGCAEDEDLVSGTLRTPANDSGVNRDAGPPIPGAEMDASLADASAVELPDTGDVTDVDMSTVPDAILPDADLEDAGVNEPDLGPGEPDSDLPDADLTDADLTDADLADAEPDAGAINDLDLDAPGPYAVGVEANVPLTLSNGTRSTLIVCAPERRGERLTGGFPLVIISPGFQLSTSQYQSYCEGLAAWGFFTVIRDLNVIGFSADHPAMAADLSALIDTLTDPATGYLPYLNPDHIAAAGHSLGGKLSALAAADDARIGAVLGWDPVDSDPPNGFGVGASVVPERGPDLTTPLLVFGETLDETPVFGFGPACAPADQNYTRYYEAAAGPAVEITFTDADHVDWLDNTLCGLFCNSCWQGTADDEVVKSLTLRTSVAFLLSHLQGEPGLEPWISGERLDDAISSGTLTVRARD